MTDRVGSDVEAGLVFDDRYLQHNPGLYPLSDGAAYPFVDPVLHLSNHRLVMRTKHLIDLSGLSDRLERIPARSATESDLRRYHTGAHIARVKELSAGVGGETGDGAPAGPGSYEVARLAAGGVLAAVDAVVAGSPRRIFANVRPPGHHAVSDRGMGYCLFNNVALAALYARERHGLQRILIVDWDVHHGNGTQDAFWTDPNVLFISLHQAELYPARSGLLEQTGEGEGAGYTVNIPLPAGCGDAAYRAACERVVLPIANAFQPELVIVSAGQDANAMDQHGRMSLSTGAYRWMTQAMIDLAETHAAGRLVIAQEGGYSELYAPYCTLAIVETLAEHQTNLPEPIAPDRLAAQPQSSTVGQDAEAAIAAAEVRHGEVWGAPRFPSGV